MMAGGMRLYSTSLRSIHGDAGGGSDWRGEGGRGGKVEERGRREGVPFL